MAKRNRIDRKQLEILIDTSKGVDQLGYLQEMYRRLAQEAKTTESAMTARAVERQMIVLRDRMQDVREELGLQGMTVNQLRQYYRELDRESKTSTGEIQKKAKLEKEAVLNQLDSMNEGMSRRERQEKSLNDELQRSLKANRLTGLSLDQLKLHHRNLTEQIQQSTNFESAANRQRIAEAQKVQNVINQRQQQISGVTGIFSYLKTQMPSAIAGAVGGLAVGAFSGIMSAIRGIVDQGINYIKERARSVSEIQNILLVDQGTASKIFNDLRKIDTETTRKQLKELVLVAGDLNVATEDVIKFVTAADKLEKVFARDFEGIGNASTEITKMKESYKETADLEIEEGLGKIGSAIKELNDAGPATTKGMSDFLSRVGQLPDAFKPAITEALALAAVFEEANITAQISSGGITNVLLTASKYGEEFGSMFGMAKDEFLSFLSENPTEFLTKFASKLNDMDPSMMGELFKNLHIESQESIKTLGTLSNNLEKFYQKQEVAVKAFAEGTRIDQIFKVLNEDASAELSKAQKRISSFTNSVGGLFGQMANDILIGFSKILPDVESDFDKITRKMNEQKAETDELEGKTKTLVSRYGELRDKANLSAEEQVELQNVIKELASILPSAISEWDKYGNAIGISTDRIRENIIEQRKVQRELEKDRKAQLREDIADTKKQIDQVRRYIGRTENSVLTDKDRLLVSANERLRLLIADYNAGLKQMREIEYGGQHDDNATGSEISTHIADNKGNDFEFETSSQESAVKKQKELAAARIENEAKVLQEIYRMNIQAIENELIQKELLIRNDLEKEAESRRKLISEGKYDIEDFNTWHAAASQDAERQITEIKTEASDKTAKEKQAIEEKVQRMTLETALQIAEDGNDKEAILAAQHALRKYQFDIDFAKASADEKTAIYERYLADIARLDANYLAEKKADDKDSADWWYEYFKEQRAKEQADERQKEQDRLQLFEQRLDFAGTIADGVSGIYANSLLQQENDLRVSLQEQFDQLTEQKARGFLTEEQYQLAKLNLEKKSDRELAEIKRKQAIADKAAALIQIAINTAIAASKAASQTGVGAALAVPLVIAGGAAQAAVVASQPIPSFYAGGNTGPTFGNVDPLGGKMAIVHPNEEIIPAAVTQTPAFTAIKPMIDSITPSSAPASGGDQTPGNTVNVEFGDLPATLADLKKTNEMLMKRLENLTVGMRGSDWRRFHEDYTDYLKQNENALINE